MTKWHRIADLNINRKVIFNHTDSPNIASIAVNKENEYFFEDELEVHLTPGLLRQEEVLTYFRGFSGTVLKSGLAIHINESEKICKIYMPSCSDSSPLEEFFSLLQKWPEVLTQDLKEEFRQIYDVYFHQGQGVTYKHIIDKMTDSKFSEMTDMTNYIYYPWEEEPTKCILKMLGEGIHPNRPDVYGHTVLYAVENENDNYLILNEKKRFDTLHLLRILLAYGANPLQRNSGSDSAPYPQVASPYSPYELAVFRRNQQHVQLYESTLCTPRKAIEPFVLSPFDIVQDDKRMKTIFRTPEGVIEFELFHAKYLTESESKEIYFLYERGFKPSKVIEKDMPHFFAEEFTCRKDEKQLTGKDKFVEKISFNGKPQGVNLYEIVVDEKHKDVIFLHISCVLMEKEVRGKGLTNPLVFASSFALQKLFPDKIVVCVYQAISYGSANLVKNIKYFPKYSPFLSQLAPVIIDHIQHQPSTVQGKLLRQDGIVCCSPIEVECVPEESKGKPVDPNDVSRLLFEKMRGRTLSSEDDNHLGVLIMLLAGDELFVQFATLCQQAKLEPLLFIDRFAETFLKPLSETEAFSKLVSEKKPEMSRELCLVKVSAMLFNGKVEKVRARDLLPETARCTR